MSRTTLTILAAGLTVAACNHASEQRVEDGTPHATATADVRIEKTAERLLAAIKRL
ncbi:hypothetical protein BV98_003282 [Sphingobium herbicidovorans NBRC 16415]|uniref:Lipoprotein n=1 Tax=Sphingobium herbicidovorans (strain ATCC 700291 / DSM 11019 / CCUG 56400 / KCTC 2939 / LMG 18315 / NBRC 16415 / MH) TaxID=1219045 RepID=A0A086P664_SPHHM|nr:hypothetical protein BV98_003282 [Sphingobium herbicidovorans NBRC 16415]